MVDASQYQRHYASKLDVYQNAADKNGYDCVIVSSGSSRTYFRDDLHLPFKCNPYFKEWMPLLRQENAILIVSLEKDPVLFLPIVEDFWHSSPDALPTWGQSLFNVKQYKLSKEVNEELKHHKKIAYIGDDLQGLGICNQQVEENPESVLNYIDYFRAWKTEYEQLCLQEANSIAVKGHAAAKKAFYQGCSEYEIHQAYLFAAQTREEELPYGNIIALNKNASVLHHMVLNKQREDENLTLLIDAGYDFNGYAADISRTYTKEKSYYFEELITRLNKLQKDLVSQLVEGETYLSFHQHAYQKVTELLCQFEIITCSVEEAVDKKFTSVFFPHGVGHLLGIQVHDRGGYLVSADGESELAPKEHPYLRCTREIQQDMVFTVEPGVYFIEAMLKRWKGNAAFNWPLINLLQPHGGVRIEDNVIVKSEGNLNLTREAFKINNN